MQQLDFLFITSPTNASNAHLPYYFLYLAAYLESKGLSVGIVDLKGGVRTCDIEKHLETISKVLRSTLASFVGLAAFHPDYDMVMRLGKLVKEIRPETTLLVGNAHSTIAPEDFIYEGSPFDIAVLGEGEETCLELFYIRDFDNDYRNTVRGIAHYSHDVVVKMEPRPFMDISTLPWPAYHLIDMEWYIRPQKQVIRRFYTSSVAISASRGCPYDCYFCAAGVVWKANTGKAVRMRPVHEVLAEMYFLKERYDVDFFYFMDDAFCIDKKWMEEWFCKKTSRTPYACQTRANLITEDMIKGLSETGCLQVDIGVESGSQILLDAVNKRITVKQVRQAVGWCRKYNVRYFFTIMLNLPTETEDDLHQTWALLKELKPDGVAVNVATPFPGTSMHKHYSCGLKKEDYHLLMDNVLEPMERFRMAAHHKDLAKLRRKWCREFKATPMFERMWCFGRARSLYWGAVLGSARRGEYVRRWIADLPRTFLSYWARRMGLL